MPSTAGLQMLTSFLVISILLLQMVCIILLGMYRCPIVTLLISQSDDCYDYII